MPIFFASLLAISVTVAVIAVNNIRRTVPRDDRRYLDPLPAALRPIWPLVNVFAHYFGERISVEYIERTRAYLQRSGLMFLMSPEQFIGLQVVIAVLAALVCWVVLAMAGLDVGAMPLVAAAIGYFLPLTSIKDRRKKREKEIVRSLSVYLDYVTMAVEAGLNLNGALVQAVDKGPEGPLKTELQRVLGDIKAGMARLDALRAMSDRLGLKEISSLVSALAQAEKTGGSIGQTLRVQADQRRIERFQRAEKLAMEAPVKLVFPLVAFIFPTTFVILFFPIVMKFMYDL
ncbi:type II secretion system F family protein [Arhodomonas sp. AD133]|uniref:type II secretion system F family protein n=1 Tax=Arhodomonas sp. AD133 TaxID=3415009 RepID=UPI003EB8BDCE